MSNAALTWAFRRPIDDMAAKFLLVRLADRADEEDGRAFSSIEKLAKETAQSERSVQRKLRWLAAEGYLRIVENKTEGKRQRANDYFLVIDPEERAHLRADQPAQRPKNSAENGCSAGVTPVSGVSDSHPREGDTQSPIAGGEGVTGDGGEGVTGDTPNTNPPIEPSESPLDSSTCSDTKADAEGERADSNRIKEEFQKLCTVYGAHAGMDLARALKLFRPMNVKTRELAMRKAPIAKAASGAKKHRKDLANWLDGKPGERDFELIADLAQGQAEAQGKPRPDLFAKRGTPAYDLNLALMSLTQTKYRQGHVEPLCRKGIDGGTGIDVQEYFPDLSHAFFAPFDAPQYEAWRRWTAVKLGREEKFFTMKSVDFKDQAKPGWYFPSEWPPGWQESFAEPRAPPDDSDLDGIDAGSKKYG